MKIIINGSIFLMMLSFLFGNVASAYALDENEITTTIDTLMEEKMSEENIPNAVVSIVYDGEIIFEKGYGYARIDTKDEVDPNRSLFRIGSISKLMTWTAVMQLVERGKLDLDTDINEYIDFEIPEYKNSGPITLRHLLTHTPGFEDYSNKIFTLEEANYLPLNEYVRELLPERILPAGEVLAYSNYGTALAGYIVEQVSGVPYDTYIEENIFNKLNMENSTFKQPIPEPLARDAVTPYRYVDGEFKEAKFEYMPAPAGGMSSTASDMANFMIAFLQDGKFSDEQILKEQTVKQMLTQQFTHHPELNGMALGFIQGDVNGKRVMMHGGSTMLFNSMLYLLPDEKLGIFISYSGGNHLLHNEVIHEFMHTFYPQEDFVSMKNASQVELKKYAGEYHQNRKSETTDDKFTRLIIGVILVKAVKDGYLEVTHMGEKHRFYEAEPGVFKSTRTERSPDAYGNFDTIVFKEDAEGNILLIPDGPMTYTKAPLHETSSFMFMSLGAVIVFIVVTLIVWGVLGLIRMIRKTSTKSSNVNRFTKWVGVIYGFMIVLLLGNLIINGETDPVYQLPKEAYGANEESMLFTIFPYVFVVAAIGLIVSLVQLWWKRSVGLLRRIHYTLYTGTAAYFVWLFYYWNL